MRHNPNNVSLFSWEYGPQILLNILIVFFSVTGISLASSSTIQKYAFGRQYEAVEVIVMGKDYTSSQLSGITENIIQKIPGYNKSDSLALANEALNEKVYSIELEYGDGPVNIARKAIGEFGRKESIILDEKEAIYAEETLRKTISVPAQYNDGIAINVTFANIKSSVYSAKERYK